MRRRRSAVLVLFATTLLCACGNDDPAGPGDEADAAFTATIDGQPWQSDDIFHTVTAGGGSALPGALVINGQAGTAGDTRGILLLLGFIEGAGTYPLGVNNATTAGGTGQVILGSGAGATSYLTPYSGDAGSITISSISDGRLVGTFAFTATPIVGGGASVNVTSGTFDTALPSNFAPVSGDGRGSSMTATVNGSAWVGATNLAVGVPGAYAVSGSNLEYSITIATVGTTTGSLAIGTQVTVTVTQIGATSSWGGTGSTGTVTVTGGGTARSIGTFSGTLAPNVGAVGNMVITNGTFDIKLP